MQHRTEKSGSLPLQILKKLGYKINVYSSAQHKFYGMKEVIFGTNAYLADSYNYYCHYDPVPAHETDRQAVDEFIAHLDKRGSRQGNVFLIFLDSTHFNYSWPDDYPTHFKPISQTETGLQIQNSPEDIEKVKNRYRNSIHYADSLFGEIVDALKTRHLYHDSCIVFTGDHGEEFYEEGQLFHASHLSAVQTEVPIYYKLGNRPAPENVDRLLTSHIDIFPTLFDHLLSSEPFASLYHGESIYREERTPYVIAGRHNGPRTPKEFILHDGTTKLTFRLQGNKLSILKISDLRDNILQVSDVKGVAEDYTQAFVDRYFQSIER